MLSVYIIQRKANKFKRQRYQVQQREIPRIERCEGFLKIIFPSFQNAGEG